MSCREPRAGYDENTELALLVGKEYVVYGVTTYLGCVWYYICDENYSYYPIWNPAAVFEVVDGRISAYWSCNHFQRPGNSKGQLLLAFKEWTADIYYYDRLTDGDELAVSIFQHYKALMDAEFE